MFASHRDACILSKYNCLLSARLEAAYEELGIDRCVAAYRSLGKTNYHFAKEVQDFVRSQESVAVLCFDVHGFFDHLCHARLKTALKTILDVKELSPDWYQVYRQVTKFRYVLLEHLKSHDDLKERLRARQHPIVTIGEVKQRGIAISKNPDLYGIPQGTPISATLSNLYMLTFDALVQARALEINALYRRYSDDILVACRPEDMQSVEEFVLASIASLGLEIQSAKTERVILSGQNAVDFQYLGFLLGASDAKLRPKSLSKQWRSLRRSVRKTKKIGERAIASGKAEKIFRRKICVRFTDAGKRNFIGYAQRASDELQSPTIRRQIKKLRKFAQRELAALR